LRQERQGRQDRQEESIQSSLLGALGRLGVLGAKISAFRGGLIDRGFALNFPRKIALQLNLGVEYP